MRNDLFRMGVVCGIVILFIGASVLPATETINNPRKNDIVIYPNFIKTITVDDEGDGDYTRIQNAINHANFGDTIEVYSGTYVENVVVDKMIDLVGKDYELGSGSDTGKPVIDGSGTGTVVKTTSDGVKITGFMIQHSGSSDPGIHLASHYNIIQDNVVTGNFYGMKLFPSTGNEITCNIISNNSGDGLWLSHSHENTIENNSITGNANDGISANLSSLSNHIEYNYIAENKGRGIELSETSFGSKIKMNNITKNTIGFETTGGSDNNLFHLNNLIKNVQNAKDNSANRYDDNGMGNYWDDYTGVDDDGDGIGDTPYVVPGEGENQDDYPFMAPLVINYAPLKPDPPKGPADGQGKVGKLISFSVEIDDPEAHNVYCMFNWGDGTDSGWIGPQSSGSTFTGKHMWSAKGNYSVMAKGKDIYDAEGDWSDPTPIAIPKNKVINTPFLRFLECYPGMFPLLRHLLGL